MDILTRRSQQRLKQRYHGIIQSCSKTHAYLLTRSPELLIALPFDFLFEFEFFSLLFCLPRELAVAAVVNGN
jgi:hypothetical protein